MIDDIYKSPKYSKNGLGLLDDSRESSYPKVKVMLFYPLTGGAVGGILLWLFGLIVDGAAIGNLLVFFVIYGAMFGFMPALITGVILAQLKIVIHSIYSYAGVGAIGFGVSLVCILIVVGADGEAVLGISAVGGVSSIILAILFLPKN